MLHKIVMLQIMERFKRRWLTSKSVHECKGCLFQLFVHHFLSWFTTGPVRLSMFRCFDLISNGDDDQDEGQSVVISFWLDLTAVAEAEVGPKNWNQLLTNWVEPFRVDPKTIKNHFIKLKISTLTRAGKFLWPPQRARSFLKSKKINLNYSAAVGRETFRRSWVLVSTYMCACVCFNPALSCFLKWV